MDQKAYKLTSVDLGVKMMSNVNFSAYVLNYPLIKSSFISNSIFQILALQVEQIYNTPSPPNLDVRTSDMGDPCICRNIIRS